MSTIAVSLIQTCATRDIDRNIDDAAKLIDEAAKNGAQYIQTPEQTGIIDLDRQRVLALSNDEANTKALQIFSDLAKQHRTIIHIGSLGIKISDDKAVNRTYVFGQNGDILARYDKIHMFDVTLADGEKYKESDGYLAGNEIKNLTIPFTDKNNGETSLNLGLAICYDLRFPHLFRTQAHRGAEILTCPSAFTETTGKAHWHILLRARAIENGAFMLAAGQAGLHECGRRTYGHSLIISPWGEILAEGDQNVGIISATINLHEAKDARARIPVLDNDRIFKADCDVN